MKDNYQWKCNSLSGKALYIYLKYHMLPGIDKLKLSGYINKVPSGLLKVQ